MALTTNDLAQRYAERFGEAVSVDSLRRLCRAGTITADLIGGTWIIQEEHAEAFLDSGWRKYGEQRGRRHTWHAARGEATSTQVGR